MEKLVYVAWKPGDVTPKAYKATVLERVTERFRELGVKGLTVNLADEHAADVVSARITRLDPPPDGLISFWLDAADDRGPYEQAIADCSARQAGYWVVESVPIVNTTQTAAAGERTPGINMVALLERPSRIAWDAWIDHWHGPHKKVAFETQCTFHYVRNVVVRSLTDSAPAWSGIVEEGFPAEAITDPMIWYCAEGDPKVLQRNLKRMIESCTAFLELDRVESHPMSEYRIL